MRRILQTFLPFVATMLFCSAQSKPGTCHLLPGGGGSSGVWVLPRVQTFAMAEGERCDARFYDGNGIDFQIPDFCERGGNDMYLGTGGTIAVVYGFFDPEATSGTWYDVTNGQTAAWNREDT